MKATAIQPTFSKKETHTIVAALKIYFEPLVYLARDSKLLEEMKDHRLTDRQMKSLIGRVEKLKAEAKKARHTLRRT